MRVPHLYRKALLIDIDGTVVEHIGDKYLKGEEQLPLDGAVDWVNKKYEEGYGIFFFTSRLPEEKEKTEAMLDKHGFKYNDVIYGKPYADITYHIDDRKFKSITIKRNTSVATIKDKDLK